MSTQNTEPSAYGAIRKLRRPHQILGLPPEEWRVEIRALCCHGDADLGHVRPRLNRGSIANSRVQASSIIEYLDVIEHRCFGFLAGSEAGGYTCSFFGEAKKLSMGALSRQSPRRLMD